MAMVQAIPSSRRRMNEDDDGEITERGKQILCCIPPGPPARKALRE